MALVRCPKCNTLVSTRMNTACPNCGCVLPVTESEKRTETDRSLQAQEAQSPSPAGDSPQTEQVSVPDPVSPADGKMQAAPPVSEESSVSEESPVSEESADMEPADSAVAAGQDLEEEDDLLPEEDEDEDELLSDVDAVDDLFSDEDEEEDLLPDEEEDSVIGDTDSIIPAWLTGAIAQSEQATREAQSSAERELAQIMAQTEAQTQTEQTKAPDQTPEAGQTPAPAPEGRAAAVPQPAQTSSPAEQAMDQTPETAPADQTADRTPEAAPADQTADRAPEAVPAEQAADRAPEAAPAEQAADKAPEEPVSPGKAPFPAEEETSGPKFPGPRLLIPAAVIAALILALAAFFGTKDMRLYAKAKSNYEAGNYDEAVSQFTQLGDYKDAVSMIHNCQYQKADAALSGGNYQEAYDGFAALTEYFDDAGDKMNESAYLLGKAEYEAGNYLTALDKLSPLGDYKDAKTLATDCQYQLSADAGFIKDLAAGFGERCEQGAANLEDPDYDEEAGSIKLCDIELARLEQYEEEIFDNPGLEEDAMAYIKNLKDAKTAVSYYEEDFDRYVSEWDETYAKRAVLIQKFVSEHGLKVDKKYQENLDTLLAYAKEHQPEEEETDSDTEIEEETEESEITEESSQETEETEETEESAAESETDKSAEAEESSETRDSSTDTAETEASAEQEADSSQDPIETMTDSFQLTLEDEDGKLVHRLHMENTTDYTFDDFSVEVSLLDGDGNIIDSGSSDTVSSWEPGQESDVIVWLDGDPDPKDYTVVLRPHYNMSGEEE